MPYDVDLFIIGAGSGGVRMSRIASGHGARVHIAEEHQVGGTCVIRGCVPKKLLVIGAHFAEDLEDAQRFGWTVKDPSFSWPTLRDHVLNDVARLNTAYQSTLDNAGVTTHHARAVIKDPHTVEVGGETLSAAHIVVATGARPLLPELPGAEHGITSNECFHLDALPKRMAIAGGGYIANEFAGIFHELGVEVTIVNRSGVLLRGWEPALSDRLQAISSHKGIQFRFDCRFTGVDKRADGSLHIGLEHGSAIETDMLLWAIGRVPNTEGLGLEAAGVKVNNRGAIIVDDNSRTSVESIHAIGDVTDRLQLTPIAIREGQALADHLFGGRADASIDYSYVPSAVFSHPPLASVGMTEGQARNSLSSVKVYQSDFRPMKNVLADRNERALYKLVVDDMTGRIVGAHMIGPDAPEIMQMVAVAVKAGLTKAQLDDTVALHPTMAEELVLMR